MATAADAFLADLEDLQDDVLQEEGFGRFDEDGMDGDGDDDGMDEDGADGAAKAIKVSTLLRNPDYKAIIEEVTGKLENEEEMEELGNKTFTEEDPEYKLVRRCNTLVQEIDEEIIVLYAEV